MRRGERPRAALALALAATLTHPALDADAKTLRWAGRGDMQTTDPHSQNENLTNNINQLVYEFLVVRDKKLGLVPALAESWTQVSPTTWRFKLRAGVKFHDGPHFPGRRRLQLRARRARHVATALRSLGHPEKIDDLTVEFTTNGPNPVELEHIVTINIMSKAWCERTARRSRRTIRRRRT
jgi:peptide/nickel transport system substrate-binding protein